MTDDLSDGAAFVTRVDAALRAFLDGRAMSLARVGPEPAELVDAARGIALDGGKRLRPLFVLWGWRATRNDVPDPLVAAAAAVELLHCCALVHDDLMDSSDTRRGSPAAHSRFSALHAEQGWTGGAEAFGAAGAILLGDLLLSWSDTLFAGAGFGPAARSVYDDMRQLVMAGQYLDVRMQAQGAFSAADALRVIEFKTSKYTVEGPLHLGAAAAGAPPETMAALSAYAMPIGEAFQLRDDILGVWGDPAVTGKPAGDDLREGKRTLLVALAMQRADADEQELLRAELGNRALDPPTVHRLRQVLVDTGALDEVEKRIAACTREARTGLRAAAIDPSARAALDDLAVAATQRRT